MSPKDKNIQALTNKGYKHFLHLGYMLPPTYELHEREVAWVKECVCYLGKKCLLVNCNSLEADANARLHMYVRDTYQPSNSI